MVFSGPSAYHGSMGGTVFLEMAMSNVLYHWIFIGSNAYDEYTFVPWLNKTVYRRTVDLNRICIQ